MKIGIVGSGNIGAAIGTLLSRKGHNVMFSYTKDENKLLRLGMQNDYTSSGSLQAAVTFGDVIFIAVPFSSLDEVLSEPILFKEKIVISCVNGLQPDFTGDTIGIPSLLSSSVAELIHDRLQVSKVIEAFNISFAAIYNLPQRHLNGKKPVSFYCGDDIESKKVVAGLIEDCDCIPVNAGGLKTARSLETLAVSWMQFAVVAGLSPRIALHTLHF